jgi:energy-converting hydrogenase A subunit P
MSISYDGGSCIRNSYFHNNCSNCVDVCPERVFSIFQNKIALDSNLCTLCSACLGVCPSEALKLESFDPNRFSVEFRDSEKNGLSCKDNSPCLSGFDVHHFSLMVLDRKESISCDLSHCESCEMGQLKSGIEERIESSNRFLKSVGSENLVEIIYEKSEEEPNKREFFGKIFGKAKEKSNISEERKLEIEKKLQKPLFAKRFYPLKQHLLVEEVKNFENLENFSSDIISTQKIDYQKCTNCGDCTQFCPTEALFYSSDKLDIFIHSNKCITCGICHHICKESAIERDDEVSLIDLMRPKNLIHFHMEVCDECKTPFIQRKDEKICERCIDFTTNMSHMFTLARDI